MRFLAVLFACLFVPFYVEAKPSPYRADTFSGDRYVARAPEAQKRPVVRQRYSTKVRYLYRVKRAPVNRARPWRADPPLTVPAGIAREFDRATANFIRGRLICAANVGAELARRGIKGTGSRLAMSYRTWGKASGPVPGAVAVFRRRGGGHVAIVHSVQPNGQVIYLNPSSRRQAWVIGPYRRQPIAYRVAG